MVPWGVGLMQVGLDDQVLPFAVDPLDIRGRIVRLGPSIDTIISRHAYPACVSHLVGQAVALCVLLGTSLKFQGRFQLQTRTSGAVDMIIVDFEAPGQLRAYARFDAGRVASEERAGADAAALLGVGHLALTIDPGGDMNRYQGVVALEGQGLEEAAHQYFRQSEQIPTRVRLAVGETIGAGHHAWRAGGILVQFLPRAARRQGQADLPPGDIPEGYAPIATSDEEDAWVEARALVDTVEDHELLDPLLPGENLLYRLFHERGVRVFEAETVQEQCRCSRERIIGMLKSFSPEERAGMVGDGGTIGITCEFCSSHYEVTQGQIGLLEGDGL